MKSQQSIQYALMCLSELDRRGNRALSPIDVSRRQGVPLEDCRQILGCLSAAGLIESTEEDRYTLRRDLSELTALEVVQAIAKPVRKDPRFRLMVGSERRWVLRMTLKAVSWAERHGIYLSDNGK